MLSSSELILIELMLVMHRTDMSIHRSYHMLPLLHRPTFEGEIADGLHERDSSFARVVLLVCAHGARIVNDPRVYLSNGFAESRGWFWFSQTQIWLQYLFLPPRLYDVQACILGATFAAPSFQARLAWMLVGNGIRMLQEIGAHRRKVYRSEPNAHDELWKRCFQCV
jgi:hypothetical protein